MKFLPSRIKIATTTDYSVFKKQEGNRVLLKVNLNALRKKIKENNMLPYHPVLVNNKMEVIDGQHRLEIAEELGLEVSFINIGDRHIEETVSVNTTGSNWQTKDFLRLYLSQGKEAYVQFHEFMEAYPFLTISSTLNMTTGDRTTRDFKDGSLIIYQAELDIGMIASEKMAMFGAIDKTLITSVHLARAIRIMVRNGIEWDHERLIRLCMTKLSTMLSLPSNDSKIIDKLEEIYNIKLRKHVDFKAK